VTSRRAVSATVVGSEGAGVIGFAGSVVTPTLLEAINAGVYGESVTGPGIAGSSTSAPGVTGSSTAGVGVVGVNLSSNPATSAPGVIGFAAANRGGVFSSSLTAQMSLTPISISSVGLVPAVLWRSGDLLATTDERGTTHLWFCKAAGTGSWAKLA
jgi:hypothetical protein